MPIVTIEKPEIITISYRQERGDSDYGSCLWARFYFDTKNYNLSIESDCGSYANGWIPTPRHESFMHLCARFEKEYLLDKIDNRNVVDGDATYTSLVEFLQEYDIVGFDQLREHDMRDLRDACHSNRNDFNVLKAIEDALEGTDFDGSLSEYDIACCIEMTYPAGAKKIADIFHDHIQPVVKKIAEETP